MSLQITIPKSDLAKGIPIAKGWQKFEVVAITPQQSKNKDSVNYVVTHKLVGDVNERELDHYFNSKALGMMAPWIAALANKTVQEVLDQITSGALTIDLETCKGKSIMGNVDQQLFEGRIVSKIVDFASVDKVPF